MAFTRLPHDINFHGLGSEDGFGLRWHRLLFPIVGMPAVHLGPITFGTPAPTVEGHTEPTAPVPIDDSSPVTLDQDSSGLGATLFPTDGAPAPLGVDAAGPGDGLGLFWHPPYFASAPLTESSAAPAQGPDDAAIDHGAAGALAAAFLPPDSGDLADLQHGLDLDFMFTPPLPPPPPDVI